MPGDMTSTSAIVNRSLRARVCPILRAGGFERVDARSGWRWIDEVVWVVKIRAVGHYFSEVTGWPPGSIGVSLGVMYSFMPHGETKVDQEGRMLPEEHACNLRSSLVCELDQKDLLRRLQNPAERKRRDLWWVDPDGRNADEVAGDIGRALAETGLPWFGQRTSLAGALALVEAQDDCFAKYAKASFLAHEIGDQVLWRRYDLLAEAEARRIGHSVDRNTWTCHGLPI